MSTADRQGRSRARRLAACAAWLACSGSLLAIHGPTLRAHFELARDPLVFNDDARWSVYPYYRFSDPSSFTADYAGAYVLAATPAGLRAAYSTAARWIDPMAFTTLAPYGLLLLSVVAIGAAAWRLGGVVSAWASAVLVIGSGYALGRMADATPRAYAFPLLALVLVALVWGRPVALAALVVIATLVYPPVAVCAGLALALYLFVLPARDRGAAAGWTPRRRLLCLAVTALLAGLAWLPVSLRSRAYGPLITPNQTAEYPEAGPEGRLTTVADRVPGPGLVVDVRRAVKKALYGTGAPLVPPARRWFERRGNGRWALLAALALAGWVAAGWHRAEARRAAPFAAAALLGYLAASVAYPYLYFPERYLGYSIPVALSVVLPAGARVLVELLSAAIGRPWIRRGAVRALGAVTVAALVALLGGRSTTDTGLTVRVDPNVAAYDAVAVLAGDALIAGWPRGALDNIPYLTRRQVLVSFEVHQPYHAGYVATMRRRTEALIAAYFATTPDPIVALRDQLGATHLLVDLVHLADPPRYFQPFDDTVRRAVAQARGATYEVLRQAGTAAVYRDRRYLLLDLSRVPGGRGGS